MMRRVTTSPALPESRPAAQPPRPGGLVRSQTDTQILVDDASGSDSRTPSTSPRARPASAQRRKRAAETALAEAVRDEDMEGLLEAIRVAKAMNVARASVERGVRVLQRLTGIEALRRAIEARELGALKAALSKARAAGVADQNADMMEAKRLLKTLEVEESLRIAMDTGQSGALMCAIQGAHVAEVQSSLLNEAQAMLQQVEAHRALTAALQNEDASKLPEAISRAERAGVPQQVLDDARRRLAQLEARPPSAGGIGMGAGPRPPSQGGNGPRRHDDKTTSDVIAHLDELLDVAIAQRESGMLRMAVKFADGHGMIERAAEAQKLLSHLEAQRQLTFAMRKRDPDPKKLREAIEKAKGCGYLSPDLEVAEQMLEQCEAPKPRRQNRSTKRANTTGSSDALAPGSAAMADPLPPRPVTPQAPLNSPSSRRQLLRPMSESALTDSSSGAGSPGSMASPSSASGLSCGIAGAPVLLDQPLVRLDASTLGGIGDGWGVPATWNNARPRRASLVQGSGWRPGRGFMPQEKKRVTLVSINFQGPARALGFRGRSDAMSR
eukprot:TRINITY_DN7603_c1_g1_i1.p1 TRINITY_DN7603_c1_g1~~TRINITY_DN7603_c1_g1_i1.p1  ORF type:complete len:554 (+),score=140.85 TRINITY_DN7603_c1_g1_i1:141-1802(+)